MILPLFLFVLPRFDLSPRFNIGRAKQNGWTIILHHTLLFALLHFVQKCQKTERKLDSQEAKEKAPLVTLLTICLQPLLKTKLRFLDKWNKVITLILNYYSSKVYIYHLNLILLPYTQYHLHFSISKIQHFPTK